jgi:RNA polymerase sigma-70 factor (ECF subfamily)
MRPARNDAEALEVFEDLRPRLLALAYRMLGDVARAQDLVQETWLRWHAQEGEVASPRAFLLTVVTRLCLNELASARERLEERRGLRLPEPVDLDAAGLGQREQLERISMAFLVMLERLTPAERAVLLLHEVFDLPHEEIGALISKTGAASRKLLERAKAKAATGRKQLTSSKKEHAQVLEAFVRATITGDAAALVSLLAPNATLLTDAGPDGLQVGRIRNLRGPLSGAQRIAGFVVATSRAAQLSIERRELNGLPSLVLTRDGAVFAALLLEVAGGRIERLFFQADPARLRFLGAAEGASSRKS